MPDHPDYRDHPDGPTLASLSVLSGANPIILDEIGRSMGLHVAEAGEVLGRQGEPGPTFWLLVAGELAVSRRGRRGEHTIAVAHPGAILGELAVLRGQPRTATVTAVARSTLAIGDSAVLARLLELDPVHSRIQRLASERLAHDLSPVEADLPDGTNILVRPLLPEDRQAFEDEVHRLSRDSLRSRFFSPGGPSTKLVDYLIDIDFVDHFAWVALERNDPSRGMASARYVRPAGSDHAEMAFGTADRHQGKGLGTFLLGALGVAAVEAGVGRLVAHVMADNRAMRAVFAKADAKSGFDEPGVVFVEVEPQAAASLLADPTRDRLAASVHDIVTAASLALATPLRPLRPLRPAHPPPPLHPLRPLRPLRPLED